jgi:diacylglycerol kinase
MKTIKRFKDAVNGVATVFITQVNFRFHVIAAIIAVAAGFFFRINSSEWCMVIIAIGLVMVAEAFNTSMEFFSDFVSPGKHEQIGKVKDVAAGGVLLASLTAIALATIIFAPRIFS